MHLYEKALLVPNEEINSDFAFLGSIPWAEFLLNPRMLRGSDFLMRWSQGVWSEKRLIEAVNLTAEFFALPYGPSGVAPEEPREIELYFEKLEEAGLQEYKRPDLLIFRKSDQLKVQNLITSISGETNIPFTPDSDTNLQKILGLALAAIECENSLWQAKKMPDFAKALRPQKRLGGKLGLAKNAVLPTVIIKNEDIEKLLKWEATNSIPIHVWHVFFDLAYGISLARAKELIDTGLIEPHIQVFQAPGGATTKKAIYKIYYHYAYELGISTTPPELNAQVIEDKNGHILPYVSFKGGSLILSETAKTILTGMLDAK